VTINVTKTSRLLVVSRSSAILRQLWLIGQSNGWRIESVSNAWEAMERAQSGTTPDLLLLDLAREEADGLHILRWLRRLHPTLPIILISHRGDAGRKKEAIRMGARDYLISPLDDRQLSFAIHQHLPESGEAVETPAVGNDVEEAANDSIFIGLSPAMRKLRARATLLAKANAPVLILGESGTGKETVARLIHKLSARSISQFSKVNCEALPGDLLERELFGYEQSSAGRSPRTQAGQLELCAKGTIFLDEVTEMSTDLQARLLQALLDKRFTRSEASVEVDVRILASSSAKIEHAISEGRLREELYYHLITYIIRVPSLRERSEELPGLMRHFMHQLARRYDLPPRNFSRADIEACQSYAWPGNLRELENFVKRYLIAGGREPAFESSPPKMDTKPQGITLTKRRSLNMAAASPTQSPIGTLSGSLKSLVQSVKLEAERNAIAAALEETGWNRKAAARLLKISYRSLLYKIEQYQMKPSEFFLFPTGNAHLKKRPGFHESIKHDELGPENHIQRSRQDLL
jgi:DNA-binding NtrC family response regulator